MLSIVNCLAVIYIYNQFSKLRKAGSKYLLGQLALRCTNSRTCNTDCMCFMIITIMFRGNYAYSIILIMLHQQIAVTMAIAMTFPTGIAGLFTIFSSFVFGSTVVNLIDDKVSGLQ